MPNTKDKLTKKRLNFSSIKKKDHSNFYHFICWFSMFDATDMTNTYINSKYPKLTSKIEDVFGWHELVPKSMEELQSPLLLLSKTMLYYNVRNTKCIDLLRHLRNAFAHDNVVYDKKKKVFHVADYNKDNRLSTWGDLEEDKLYKVLQIIFDTEK